MASTEPARKGDVVEWRGTRYVVTAVYKATVHLVGTHNDVRIRCRKPVAEGGFLEATVVRRLADVLVAPVTV